MDAVGSARFVSKFDILKGYWQVPLMPHAQEIAAFITPPGLYSYTVMNFGPVLMQSDDQGVVRPVSFFSKKFNRHQLNCSTIEKEALPLVWALQHFDVYMGGGVHPVVVYSDHNPLNFLHSALSRAPESSSKPVPVSGVLKVRQVPPHQP